MRMILFVMALVLGALPLQAQTGTSIVNSKHNLSVSGPGTVKAANEEQVCIFCHTPHNAAPVRPLWNRSLPLASYKTYTSNSLKALPGQPTGSSKLCLSCHDGTIALGNVLSRGEQIQMANGITTLPPGKSNLGTDLSDDHPISFKYDNELVTRNPKLKSPTLLPSHVRLDGNKELQCVSCHDPHNNQYGNFLVMSNSNGGLCATCHSMGTTNLATHDATCSNCHKTHTAPSGPYLLGKATVSDTCLTCHSGAVGVGQGVNVGAVVNKAYSHDTKSAVNLSNHEPNNVDCKDCHEQHTMKTATASIAPAIQSTLGNVSGVSLAGGTVSPAQYEYEVCFKCHADKAADTTTILPRQITQRNLRLVFSSNAISFHPVGAKGKNTNVPSLRPGYTTDSIIYCSDCHGSETSKKAGGSGPNGPHGSTWAGMLIARYETADYTPYSTGAYALCFKCHDNSKLIDNPTSKAGEMHKKHVKEKQTPCAACHDSHGISSTQGTTAKNSHLINFNTNIVQPETATQKLEFNNTNNSCYLKCHNKNHAGLSYN